MEMEWRHEKNRIILRNVENFDLEQTFECGQCFRWNRLENGNWLGIVRGWWLRPKTLAVILSFII